MYVLFWKAYNVSKFFWFENNFSGSFSSGLCSTFLKHSKWNDIINLSLFYKDSKSFKNTKMLSGKVFRRLFSKDLNKTYFQFQPKIRSSYRSRIFTHSWNKWGGTEEIWLPPKCLKKWVRIFEMSKLSYKIVIRVKFWNMFSGKLSILLCRRYL